MALSASGKGIVDLRSLRDLYGLWGRLQLVPAELQTDPNCTDFHSDVLGASIWETWQMQTSGVGFRVRSLSKHMPWLDKVPPQARTAGQKKPTPVGPRVQPGLDPCSGNFRSIPRPNTGTARNSPSERTEIATVSETESERASEEQMGESCEEH